MKSTEKICVYIPGLAASIKKLEKIHYRFPSHGYVSSANPKLCFKSDTCGFIKCTQIYNINIKLKNTTTLRIHCQIQCRFKSDIQHD